ncbi:MAG: hypothetical protein ACRCXZ_10470 [Patescibacteria group bacterium]
MTDVSLSTKSLKEFDQMMPNVAIYCNARIDPSDQNVVLIEDVDMMDNEGNYLAPQLVAKHNTSINQWLLVDHMPEKWYPSLKEAKRQFLINYHFREIERYQSDPDYIV